MTGGGPDAGPAPAGRADLLAVVRSRLDAGHSVLLRGPAGIGKSTVLAAVAAATAGDGEVHVLRCASQHTDAGLPFLTLADLLESVPDRVFDRLSGAPRQALDGALLRGSAAADPPEPRAVRLAVRTLLRHLAAARPVLLVIDDLQWMDPDSVQVLAYALHRADGPQIRVLAAERADPDMPTRLTSLLPPGAVELTVGPLADEPLVALLRERTGTWLSRPVALDICRVTEGNPLFALEIAAALVRRGTVPVPGAPLPVPHAVRELLALRLATLSDRARLALLTAAVAARPTLTVLERAGQATALADLAEAERSGVARLAEDGTVEFAHPLMRAVVYHDASVPERAAVHVRLAAVADDPVQRARHIAAARPVEDESVAVALAEAAGEARRRGAPGLAAELAELAADRTPAGDREARAERRLAAAGHAHDAGRHDEARAGVEAVLAAEVSDRMKTRAKLAKLGHLGQALLQGQELLDEVLAETDGDPPLSARARLRSGLRYRALGRFEAAVADARRAATEALEAGDTTTEFIALELLLSVQRVTGDPDYPRSLRHALDRLASCPQARAVSWPVRYEEARGLVAADRPADARRSLADALSVVEQYGEPTEISAVRCALVHVEVRLGRCRAALDIAERLRRMEQDGDLEHTGPDLAARARAELAGGSPEQAQRLAARGIEESRRIGDRVTTFINRYLLGSARLFAGDVPGAVEVLRPVRPITAELGILDHAYFQWPVDLSEALVASGELAQAHEVIGEARGTALRLRRESLLAGLDRSAALLTSAEGGRDEAIGLLESVIERYRALSLPLELVRSLVALATVQRRSRRRAAAQKLLTQARELAATAESKPWLERIDGELERLNGAPGARGGRSLTPIESRIVDLIIAGATNRQIAVTLSISVKTVESAISRIYRKLGIRSRVELARFLSR